MEREKVVRRKFVTMGLLLAAGTSVQAADATLDAARRCGQVRDSLERLVCYDRLFAEGAVPAAAAPPARTAPPAAAPAVVRAPAAAPAAPAVAPAAPAVAPAAPAVVAPIPARDMGAEQIRRTEREREAEGAPNTLQAAVTELRETRPQVYRITLDNGHVWQQMDMDSRFTLKVGDSVQIDKGRLGGYRMARISDGRSSWVRVTRVK